MINLYDVKKQLEQFVDDKILEAIQFNDIKYTENESTIYLNDSQFAQVEAIPKDQSIDELRNQLKSIYTI